MFGGRTGPILVNALQEELFEDLAENKNKGSEIRYRGIKVMTINEFVDKYIYGISGTDAFIR